MNLMDVGCTLDSLDLD